MKTPETAKQRVTFHRYNTVIVGAGAAGMNCAVHLYEFLKRKGVEAPQDRIAVVTRGLALGASRMSGSDKQTYYKLGTSPNVPDCAEAFADTLTAAGCCHADLALTEGINSLREFYHLVQAGVAFPTDALGAFLGYKTDHDPAERATSAGPKTSKFMSEGLQRQAEHYGIRIFDNQETAHLLTVGSGKAKRIAGIVAVDCGLRIDDCGLESSIAANPKSGLPRSARNDMIRNPQLNVFLAANVVLAAGGPGELYQTSVYPRGQFGLHGLAFQAGLTAENLTESQFGLASIQFRWNVSGTYMQVVPRIFSTDEDPNRDVSRLGTPAHAKHEAVRVAGVPPSNRGQDARDTQEHDFLAGFFPSMKTMATAIFLKGYQWPFDPQKIENMGSSLIDVLVYHERQKGRRVFLDFRQNPIGTRSMQPFNLDELAPEAFEYLRDARALQNTPIERLIHMNSPAVEIYQEHGIDLRKEPLEIAVCAQHNNGGFAVNKWWESSIPHTFVIGEMAGTHGVKRPGGSALNAGQVGGLRAAEYIANVYGGEPASHPSDDPQIERQIQALIDRLDRWNTASGRTPQEAIEEIQSRMTASAAQIRQENDATQSLRQAVDLWKDIQTKGLPVRDSQSLVAAIQAEHLALSSIAYLKAIVELLVQDGGSRGSYLVLSPHGVPIHPEVLDKATGEPLAFRPENPELRDKIQQIEYDERAPDLFRCTLITPRMTPVGRKSFEPAWREYREGGIYQM